MSCYKYIEWEQLFALTLFFFFVVVVHFVLFVNITFILFVFHNLCLSEGTNVKNCFAIINNNLLYIFFPF